MFQIVLAKKLRFQFVFELLDKRMENDMTGLFSSVEFYYRDIVLYTYVCLAFNVTKLLNILVKKMYKKKKN
jgi:hypothetical protein